MSAFNAGLSGLKVSSAELGVAGNNIANANTTGFKESRAEFSDIFASSALGTSDTSVGAGVKLNRVAQQFTQGTINFTENNLDLAVNGEGFFVLDKGGERLYSRSGALTLDRDGFIVNSDGANLVGRLAVTSSNSPAGEISGQAGHLKIDTHNIAPVKTSNITSSLNLDSSDDAPAVPFTTGFNEANPPSLGSFNHSTSTTIYDSLGNSHILTLYFVKKEPHNAVNPTRLNQWQAHIGIDGNDVSPAPDSAQPRPFTLVFDANGQLQAHDPDSPPNILAAASVTSTNSGFVNTGSLTAIDAGDLSINGVNIAAPSSDGVSTADPTKSALAIAKAINAASVPGLSASSVSTTVDLGTYTPGAAAMAGGNLTINGVNIVPASASEADLRAAITAASGATGVTVSGSGNIVLSAADGRNIQVATNAASIPAGTHFSHYSLANPADKVQRGSVQIQQSGPTAITISGNNPLEAGFVAGTAYADVDYTNSDAITLKDWDPKNGAQVQDINLDFSQLTQYGSPFTVHSLKQDGATTGRMASIDVDSNGIISGRFTNGQNRKLGQVMLANFSNTQGLSAQGEGYWSETFSSGSALLGTPQTSSLGSLQSGALEDSNVQLTKQLVKLITAQRNFQANAQTIRTADQVTQSIINLR